MFMFGLLFFFSVQFALRECDGRDAVWLVSGCFRYWKWLVLVALWLYQLCSWTQTTWWLGNVSFFLAYVLLRSFLVDIVNNLDGLCSKMRLQLTCVVKLKIYHSQMKHSTQASSFFFLMCCLFRHFEIVGFLKWVFLFFVLNRAWSSIFIALMHRQQVLKFLVIALYAQEVIDALPQIVTAHTRYGIFQTVPLLLEYWLKMSFT